MSSFFINHYSDEDSRAPAAFERYPPMQLHAWLLPPATLVSPAHRSIFSSRRFCQVLPGFFPVSQTGNSLKTGSWGSETHLIYVLKVKDHSPLLPHILYLANHCFKCFVCFVLFPAPPTWESKLNS